MATKKKKVTEKTMAELWEDVTVEQIKLKKEYQENETIYNATKREMCELIKANNIPAKVVELTDTLFYLRSPNSDICYAYLLRDSSVVFYRTFLNESDLVGKSFQELTRWMSLHWTAVYDRPLREVLINHLKYIVYDENKPDLKPIPDNTEIDRITGNSKTIIDKIHDWVGNLLDF